MYNGTSNSTVGMLQICNSKGHWTAVCDYSFGCSEATVACKQLGYYNAGILLILQCYIFIVYLVPRYYSNAGPWTEIGFGPYSYCSSSYSSLFSCSVYSSYYTNSPYYCSPMRDTVKLQCVANSMRIIPCVLILDFLETINCTNNEVRLVGGKTKHEGILEICYGNVWRAICSSYASSSMNKVASTVCNQLNYGSTSSCKYTII